MNYNGEDPEELGELGDVLPAELLKKLNVLLEQLHHAEHPHHGSNTINIYASGSQHVDTIINFNGEGNRKEQGQVWSDEQIAQAIEAICGEGKALDTKQKWAGVQWLLRWECNYPARAKEFCERIARLPLRKDLAYKCDYRNIREFSTLSFLNEDPRQINRVKYSKNDEAAFIQLKEVVVALQRELHQL